MKKTSIFFALALLFGAKAFAQECKQEKAIDQSRAPWQWTYTYEYNRLTDSIIQRYHKAYELQDDRTLVMGFLRKRNECGSITGRDAYLLTLDSDGTELFQATFHKDGYTNRISRILKNQQGEVFLFTAFNPDHDTCSPNYFKNFEPITDHSILAFYKLNDDLTIAESHEWNITVDTIEYDTNNAPTCGLIAPFSVIIDNEGYIVGAYSRVGSRVPHPTAMDSTIFFKMDFEGNILKRVGYETIHSGADYVTDYRFNHIVSADSLYIYYGWEGEIVNQDDRNMVFLDKDFNVVRTRRFLQAVSLPYIQGDRWEFDDVNVLRSPHGTTYMTCEADECEPTGNYYVCILYEFDDCTNFWDVVPIKRYIERKTMEWDFVPWAGGVDISNDNSLYFAYSLNVGVAQQRDSWIMIEHLTPEFEVIEDLYYDLPGTLMHSEASSITATEDGGVLLVLQGYDMENPDTRYESVVKFPAETFLGIEEAHANGLKVAIAYPNPGHDELNIRTALKDARVKVYDLAGRLVHSQEITEEVTSINTESWIAGVYVWKVTADGKEAESGKWVKE